VFIHNGDRLKSFNDDLWTWRFTWLRRTLELLPHLSGDVLEWFCLRRYQSQYCLISYRTTRCGVMYLRRFWLWYSDRLSSIRCLADINMERYVSQKVQLQLISRSSCALIHQRYLEFSAPSSKNTNFSTEYIWLGMTRWALEATHVLNQSQNLAISDKYALRKSWGDSNSPGLQLCGTSSHLASHPSKRYLVALRLWPHLRSTLLWVSFIVVTAAVVYLTEQLVVKSLTARLLFLVAYRSPTHLMYPIWPWFVRCQWHLALT